MDEPDYDAEDIVKDVRKIILWKHLGEGVDEEDEDNIPSPVAREEITEEQGHDELY